MGFVLGTVALLLFLAVVLVFVAHLSQRRDVELVDWKPTRSPEVEAQNEIDDIRQMVEAQNEMRRRRGAPDLDEDRLRAEVEEEEIERLRRGDPFQPD
jgi:cytochrome P450